MRDILNECISRARQAMKDDGAAEAGLTPERTSRAAASLSA
jgi:hypothetical protein